jgi:hypothetical protein
MRITLPLLVVAACALAVDHLIVDGVVSDESTGVYRWPSLRVEMSAIRAACIVWQ